MELRNPNYPTIRATDIVFTEEFSNNFQVASNGGQINGNPIINGTCDCDGTGDYIRYKDCRWADLNDFSVWIDIKELRSVATQSFVSGDIVTSPLIRLVNGNNIQFFPNQSSTLVNRSIPTLSVGDSVKLGISFDSTTFNVNFYLNNSKLGTLTAASGFSSNPGSLEIFARLGALDFADLVANEIKLFNRILSDEEFEDLFNDSTFGELNTPIGSWNLQDKIGAGSPFTTTGLGSNANNGILGNGAGASEPYKLVGINGYEFVSDYINCGSSPYSSTNATEMSVCAWIDVRRADFDATFAVIADTARGVPAVNDGFIFYLEDRGGTVLNGLGFAVRTTSGGLRGITSTQDAIQDGINFICATYDSNNFARVYVNGEDVSLTDIGTATGDYSPNSTENLLLGDFDTTPSAPYVGKMLSVESYDKSLTKTQIRDLYLKGPRYLGNL